MSKNNALINLRTQRISKDAIEFNLHWLSTSGIGSALEIIVYD